MRTLQLVGTIGTIEAVVRIHAVEMVGAVDAGKPLDRGCRANPDSMVE